MNTLAIASCSKSEASTIFEWAIFHKLVGVDQIFLYDAGNDNTREVLEPLIREGFIVYHHWAAHPAQIQAMQHYQAHNRDKHTYTAFIDTDEYIVPDPEQGNFNIKKVLTKLIDHTGANGLALPWVMMGSKRLENRNEDRLVISEFDRSMSFQTDNTIHCKVIAKNQSCPQLISIHNISETGQGVGFIQTDLSPYRGYNHPGKTYPYGGLYLCHYWGKSLREYKEYKIKRGGSDRVGHEYLESQWHAYNNWTNEIEFKAAKHYEFAVASLMEVYGRHKSI